MTGTKTNQKFHQLLFVSQNQSSAKIPVLTIATSRKTISRLLFYSFIPGLRHRNNPGADSNRLATLQKFLLIAIRAQASSSRGCFQCFLNKVHTLLGRQHTHCVDQQLTHQAHSQKNTTCPDWIPPINSSIHPSAGPSQRRAASAGAHGHCTPRGLGATTDL